MVNVLCKTEQELTSPFNAQKHYSKIVLSNLAKYYKNTRPSQLSPKEWETLMSYENKEPIMKFYNLQTLNCKYLMKF